VYFSDAYADIVAATAMSKQRTRLHPQLRPAPYRAAATGARRHR
jgi:hypothetical protein